MPSLPCWIGTKVSSSSSSSSSSFSFSSNVSNKKVLSKAYLPPFTPAKDGGVVSSIDMQESMTGAVENSRPITNEQQGLFKNWDYNPLPGEEVKNAAPAVVRTPSKPNMISAAPVTGDDEDDEEDEENGGISRRKYKEMQNQQKLEKEAARAAEIERKAQLRAAVEPQVTSLPTVVRPNSKGSAGSGAQVVKEDDS